jgi:hypothetical protein
MDYAQAFVTAVATAYFLWVAKCWWTTDREALEFQKKVFLVMVAISALGGAYAVGVLRGGNAVLTEMDANIHGLAAALHVPQPNEALSDDSAPKRHHLIEDVMFPGWAVFYWCVLMSEICIATSMPDRKRFHGQFGDNKEQRTPSE